jgi:hypothetical protein
MTIALATIKAALKIDYTDDDTELERIRDAAVAWVENYCGFALSSATRTMYLREFKDTVFAVQPCDRARYPSVHERGRTSQPGRRKTADYYLERPQWRGHHSPLPRGEPPEKQDGKRSRPSATPPATRPNRTRSYRRS